MSDKIKETQQKLRELGYFASEDLSKLVLLFEASGKRDKRSIPTNWKYISYKDLNYYLEINTQGGIEEPLPSASGITDKQLADTMAVLNSKLQDEITKYKTKMNERPSYVGLRYIARNYLAEVRNLELKKELEEYSKMNLKSVESPDKWNNNISDQPNDYCKIIGDNKVLYISYYGKKHAADNYKEKIILNIEH